MTVSKYNFPSPIKSNRFEISDFLGVDFTTVESEVNTRRSPDSVNMISGFQGSMDKRTGLRKFPGQKLDFNGKIWAMTNVKTFVYGTTIMPDGMKERFEIDVIIVHAGTKLWAYNPHLDTWQQAILWAPGFTGLTGTNPVLQERETNFIEYSNQNYWTLLHNNWIVDKNDLLVIYCSGSTLSGHEGEIDFELWLNDAYNINIYYPTTSIGRSPDGKTSTKLENPNVLINWRINKFLSNATDKTFVLDYDGNTYSIDAYGGLISQKKADGTWGTPHDASGNPITWTYDVATHSVTFSAVPHATYVTGEDNIEIQFFTGQSTKKVTNSMNDYLSYANYGLKGSNNFIFFCNQKEMRFRNKEIWLRTKAQNVGESTSRLYFDGDNTSSLGSNRKLGYSKLGEYLILHGEREGNSPVAYLKQVTLDDKGELIITNTPTTSQIGALSPKSFANLRDDSLFISDSGVTSILLDNFAGIQTMQDRGFYINKRLLEEPNIKTSVCLIHDNKYFIFVDDGYKSTNVYIADPRYKTNEKRTYSESFQYEWYFWKLPIKFTCAYSLADGIYIGAINDLGTYSRIFVFKNNEEINGFYDEPMWDFAFWVTSGIYKIGDKVYKIGTGGNDYYICLKDNSASNVSLTNESYWNKIEVVKDGFGNFKIPILAYWTTPIMNMGDITARKTLKNLWVRLEKFTHTGVRIYYSTQGLVKKRYDGVFDFSNLDFSRFTFSTDTDPMVIVTNRQERKFMSIQFKIESRDNTPMSLLEIVGKYTINNQYKG